MMDISGGCCHAWIMSSPDENQETHSPDESVLGAVAEALEFDQHSREVAYLEAVIDNLPVGLFAKDASDDFRFVLWNKKQEEITTIAREQALGKHDFELF
ncbi:MAG: PAS domain-containing protein, partial [Verrucomicrobia bacterium]|nr:PAS domain-containing protein [Verrucomicrobiota bacterium]